MAEYRKNLFMVEAMDDGMFTYIYLLGKCKKTMVMKKHCKNGMIKLSVKNVWGVIV